ncbi:hypothetical protein BDB00DRAFT_590974 [Zychaea mexicana]|uniref:uncharacterized protein n=1 Tax=Zychaea mexicana TaxID=64656 RepID=UPI0022FE3099|nr:uncharacterized protein BDB00DRAFT_590974 [Zychaea mexicana]KAI9497765.1 hypothetical protein BDB00DRAFT_590974 [Zychaea mexicana]
MQQDDRDPLLGTQHGSDDDNDINNTSSFSVSTKPRPQDDNNNNNHNDNGASESRHSDEEDDADDGTNQEERRLLNGHVADNNQYDQAERRTTPEPMEVHDSNEEPLFISKWDNPMWRYPLLAAFFGMFLLMFKVVLIVVLHSEMAERGPDRVLFNGTEYFDPTVILISLDGFREDYLHRNITPHLAYFGK